MFRNLVTHLTKTGTLLGYNFSKYDPNENGRSPFEKLLDLFLQLLTYTNGDFNEAMQWLNELDKEYKLTNNDYGIGDFIEDLKDKGYIDEKRETGEIKITSKTERGIRRKSLEEIFGKLKKTRTGNHHTFKPGGGDEINPETRPSGLATRWNRSTSPAPSAMHRSITASTAFACRKMTWRSGKRISNHRRPPC